ncbi:MAG: cytochrome c3 family protein [Coriobacteriia bacterium]|nr:cytochrome c3 family protein [Coriobacteriia bacterium]
MAGSLSCSAASPGRGGPVLMRRSVALLVLATALWASVTPAFAGQAGSGELFFYPCTSCHPVTMIPGTEDPSRPLPNGFKGHDVTLEGHDKLGRDDVACLTCHDDPAKDPGKLKIAGGGVVDIKGDVSQVCYRCHSAKYKEFKAGTHGRGQPKCTAAGCHDPHTPGYIYAGPLLPFTGSGFQFKVLSERAVFSPLASPPPAPPVSTPLWFSAVAAVAAVLVVGLAGRIVLERQKR